jgi:hypothetical protein
MKQIVTVILVVGLLAGVVWGGKTWTTLRANARTATFNADVENLFVALQKFKERTGSYPMGSNAEIAKILQGNNPKNVIVIIGPKIPMNEKGEFIDPWGTPLRIYFSDSGVLIRSAGPNRRFDDSTVMDADDFIRSN